MDNLRQRTRVQGTALTIEEMLNPIEEREVGVSGHQYPESGDEAVIIAEVRRRMGTDADESTGTESDEDYDENNNDGEDLNAVTIENRETGSA